jgi:hypothetical protein
LLDVMRVQATGDPLSAVVAVDHTAPVRDLTFDILVVGGGLGGVAAAARSVCWKRRTGSAAR